MIVAHNCFELTVFRLIAGGGDVTVSRSTSEPTVWKALDATIPKFRSGISPEQP
ncbi:hypothetical protein GGD67_002701 [Bradyrhizobium sp. IAR9]|uniref:hypothetical protein n=1 Tax=Bradyrhizobium sp. IAR9 TaxID=2663841 RepID=UPI0015CCB73D|nr:hypothetical protein [Bradyrhizobium sp. IAR9]NYG45243.1 hypothetical protein [Bradyrhizobium sp. IAR9]